jgi:hypothetical protein
MSYRAYATTDPLGILITQRRQQYVDAVMSGQHHGDPYQLGSLIGKVQGLDEALQDLFNVRRQEADEKGDEL